MSALQDFERGTADPVERACLAFARHVTSGPFSPERDACDTARPSIADTVRSVIREFGSDRHLWPAALLQAAAPFDPVAQIAIGAAQLVQTQAPSAIHPPKHVRRHRPHLTRAGIDWSPAVPTNDLAIPDWE